MNTAARKEGGVFLKYQRESELECAPEKELC